MTHYHILKYNNMKKIYSFIAMACLMVMPMFTACSEKGGDETTPADKTALEAEIAECQEILESAADTYPAYAIEDFQEVLDLVNEALADDNISQTAVNNLLAQLQEARETLLATAFEDIPEENLLLAYDFESEADPQVSTGSLKYEAALTAGPELIFGSNTSLPTFVEGVNGGKAISFDNGSHLEISTFDYNAVLKDEFAISVWVKPTAIVSGNYVFSINKWNTCKLNIQNEGKPFFTPNLDGNAIDSDNETAGSVTTDKWTHLVVTISLSKDQMQFFVDGRLTKTWDTEGKPALAGSAWNIPADEDHVIYIGTSSSYTPGDSEVAPETWEANESFNGAIDNLKIYDVALSAGQVSKLYSDELGE